MIFTSKKIYKHFDRVEPWLNGDVVYPVCVELDMTNACNNKCSRCTGTAGKKNKAALSLQEAITVLRQLKSLGVKAVTFSGGGEPLCNPATISAVSHALDIGLDVGFITNGLLVTESNAPLLGKCTWVRVSLDAGTQETYKFTHGVDKFYQAIAGIRMLALNKTKATLGVGFLTDDKTIPEMTKATLLCKGLLANYIQFRPYHNVKFNLAEFKKQLSECKKLETDFGFHFKVLSSEAKYSNMDKVPFPYGKCYGHNFTTVIGADYKVYLCCHFRGVEKYCLGDLRANTFKQIWHSSLRKKVTESINFKHCVPFCRCDSFNRELWELKKPIEHENFL